jgi:hypothetical protein
VIKDYLKNPGAVWHRYALDVHYRDCVGEGRAAGLFSRSPLAAVCVVRDD